MKRLFQSIASHVFDPMLVKFLTPDDSFVSIVIFHSISSINGSELVSASERQLFKLIEITQELGMHFVSLPDAVSKIANGIEGKYVALTFDDGHKDVVDIALPILKAKSIPMAVAILPSYVESQKPFGFYKGAKSYSVTWDDLHILQKELSNLTIVNHSSMHSNYSILTQSEIRKDIAKSQELINKNCGVTPVFFAYPFGFRSRESDETISELFAHILTSESNGKNTICGQTQTAFLKRTAIHGTDSNATIKLKVQGLATCKSIIRNFFLWSKFRETPK